MPEGCRGATFRTHPNLAVHPSKGVNFRFIAAYTLGFRRDKIFEPTKGADKLVACVRVTVERRCCSGRSRACEGFDADQGRERLCAHLREVWLSFYHVLSCNGTMWRAIVPILLAGKYARKAE